MVPEIGQFALILALLLAVTQGVLPIAGAARGNAAWMALARPAAQGQFTFVAIAFGCLAWSFAHNDFSVLNVATNSNSQLPIQYRLAATWGSHEGSLLLWVLMLNVWTVAVSVFSRHLPEQMAARVIGVMGLVSVGFILFMLLTSNPFERLFPAAADGRDLNPLLQDPGMVIHPPMLYMGGSVRVRHCGIARRAARCDVGALVAPVDHACVVLPHDRHHARQLVGLLRARVGRLVVLGPRRERVLHALAGGHRAHTLAGGH